MVEDRTWNVPLTSPLAALKGFLSGCLVAGGLFNQPFGFAIEAILLVLGIIVFIETIMPSSMNLHGITVMVFALTGGLITFALSITGNSPVFLAAVVIVTVLLYVRHIITGLHVLSK